MASRRSLPAVVIDASTARASGGGESTALSAVQCRDALNTVLEVGLSLAMSSAVFSEWKRHQSTFARKWLVKMYARRRVRRVDGDPDNALRNAIDQVGVPARRAAMDKDAHLVEAAFDSDSRIVSSDTRVRSFFGGLSATHRPLRAILWIAPSEPECVPWLQNGCPREPNLCLQASD
jgi:hypothetical protein